MPEWVYPAMVFTGWLLASIACIGLIVAGVMLAQRTKAAEAVVERVEVKVAKLGVSTVAEVSAGVLLALAGLVGLVFILVNYWKVVLALVLLSGGGAAAQRKRKEKRGTKPVKVKKWDRQRRA